MKFEIGCPSSDKPTSIDIPLCGSCLFDHVYVALHTINLQPAGNAWPILSLIVAQRIGEKPVLFFFLRKHVQSSSDSVFYLLAWKSIMLHVTTCYNRHVAGHGPPGEKPIVAVVRGRQEPFGGQEVFVAGGSDGFWMEKWCVEMDVFFWDKQTIEQKTDSATDSAESFSVELGTNMNQPDRDEMSLQSPESGESHGVPSYFRSCS